MGVSISDVDKSGGNEGTNSRKEKGAAGADKRDGNECTISWQEKGANECKIAQVLAFGANCPAFDADRHVDDTGDAENYIGQAMKEVASVLSLAAGSNISFAMTVEKLQREIQIDEEYKYLRKMVAENVSLVLASELAKYNYHRSNLSDFWFQKH